MKSEGRVKAFEEGKNGGTKKTFVPEEKKFSKKLEKNFEKRLDKLEEMWYNK